MAEQRLLLLVLMQSWMLLPTQPAALHARTGGRSFSEVAFAAPPSIFAMQRCGPQLAMSKACRPDKAPRRRGALLALRASGSMGPEDIGEKNAAGYPERTLAAVRRELVQRKLQCPFPFVVHARSDLFGALLERLELDGLWPEKYDKRDRNKANKQARLDAAMWAVQHSEKLQLSREQISSLAKAEQSSDADARQVVADQHNLRLTVVQVMPRTTDTFGVEWTVSTATYKPHPAAAILPEVDSGTEPECEPDAAYTRATVSVCLVYSASKYWSTAALESMGSTLDNDWMPKSFIVPTNTAAPSTVPLPRLSSGASALSGPLFGTQATSAGDFRQEPYAQATPEEQVESWPPPAARRFKTVDDLHGRDNLTAIGRSKGAGTTWKLSRDVERSYNPELILEERQKEAEGRLAETRRLRNFTGCGVSEETLRQVEADWHTEIDTLQASMAKYHAGTMSAVDFVKWYRGHFRRQFQVPPAVHNQTLPLVRAMLKRDFDIDYTGVPLTGYTGADKFFDKKFYDIKRRRLEKHAASICVDDDVYRAVRSTMDSPVLVGAKINPPEMYSAIERHIDRYFDLKENGLVNPILDGEVDEERLIRVKNWINSPPETRDLLRDLIRPDTPGSVLRSVHVTLTPEEEREVERRFALMAPAPPNMTHVEAAFRLDFPTEQSVQEWEKSKPTWYHTDDVVLEYGVLKRMGQHELARFVYDQTVRDWDFHMEYTRAAQRCGLEGQGLINRLNLLPARWVPQLADGRPIPVLSWRPRQWQEFLDPSLIAWLDEHDAMSTAPKYGGPDPTDSRRALVDQVVFDKEREVQLALLELDVENSFEDVDSLSDDTSMSDDLDENVQQDTTLPPRKPLVSPPPSAKPMAGGNSDIEDSGSLGGLGQIGVSGARRGNRGSRSSPNRGSGPGSRPAARSQRRGGPPLCAKSDGSTLNFDEEEDKAAPSVDIPDWDAIWKAPPSDVTPSGGGRPRGPGVRRTQPPDWLTDPGICVHLCVHAFCMYCMHMLTHICSMYMRIYISAYSFPVFANRSAEK